MCQPFWALAAALRGPCCSTQVDGYSFSYLILLLLIHLLPSSGPEVQHFGHAIVGDGVPISDVREGRITVPGASYNSITDGGHHLHQHIHGHEHHHHHPHHTPDGAAISDPPKDFVHDGTTYATGKAGLLLVSDQEHLQFGYKDAVV